MAESGKQHVQVTEEALKRPRFIIQSDGVYYLTLAVWAYDPSAEGLSQVQMDGVGNVEAVFKELIGTAARREAVALDERRTFSDQHTA